VPAVEATMPLRAVHAEVPSAHELRLFEGAGAETAEVAYDEDDAAGRGRRRRRTVLLGVGGAVVAVMTAAGMASGLFSYEPPTRDTALPDDVRASVPDVSPSPSRSPGPTRAVPTVTASGSIGATDSRQKTPPVLRRGSEGPEVTELELRLTQLGLYPRQPSGHYNEGVEDAVSRYQWARGIQGDELGVYGAETRAWLESETTEP